MIAFSAIFVGMIGTSYAYYVVSEGVEIQVTTGNIDTGVAVVFEQSQYINANTGAPIDDSMVDSLASSSVFKITPNEEIITKDAVVTIGITDLSIDDALKVEDFNYKLSCVDSSSTEVLSASGNGTSFTDDVISSGYLKLGSLSTTDTTNPLVVGNTYTCTLRIWLRETTENQNDLMNKKFRGLIKVNTLFRNE